MTDLVLYKNDCLDSLLAAYTHWLKLGRIGSHVYVSVESTAVNLMSPESLLERMRGLIGNSVLENTELHMYGFSTGATAICHLARNLKHVLVLDGTRELRPWEKESLLQMLSVSDSLSSPFNIQIGSYLKSITRGAFDYLNDYKPPKEIPLYCKMIDVNYKSENMPTDIMLNLTTIISKTPIGLVTKDTFVKIKDILTV